MGVILGGFHFLNLEGVWATSVWHNNTKSNGNSTRNSSNSSNL